MSATATPAAVEELAGWAAALSWEDVPAPVRDRLLLVLYDTIGVTVAGAYTPELIALRDAHAPAAGPVRLLGAGRDAALEPAVWLNGAAACALELDEGSKHARGHPAAHAFPAALALAQARRVPGPRLCAALLAGHEVAARFGRATRLRAGVHPHGNWGATGAAAAAALLLGLDARATAGAIDAAAGLVLATPFAVALRGSFVRNTWIGAANLHGIAAARLAAAGLAGSDGTPAAGLGAILGSFDAGELTVELGSRWEITRGYLKRHASCSYTHPPADAALALRERGLDPAGIRAVEVETHGLAAPLDRTEFPTRLAAMFSIPYVTAVALARGDCGPERFDDRHRADPLVRAIAARTAVVRSDAMDARLPDERAARVVLRMADGSTVTAEVANPIGDSDNRPFDLADVDRKLHALLDCHGVAAEELLSAVRALPEAPDAAAVLERLP
jgi:2-methylcitrate dehydratase PrpD